METAEQLVLRFGAAVYDLQARTYIMGILNVTPDSFSDGGKFLATDAAVRRGLEMADEGADFIDVGGESTRPGSDAVPAGEEARRVIPVIRELAKRTTVPISIDTTKAEVADRALSEGAAVVNDVSALLADHSMAEVAARHHAAVVLMHMKGTPKTMQEDPTYDDVVGEVKSFLEERGRAASVSGIGQIIVDPGIGFGKTVQHNCELIRRLREFASTGYPVLVGPSRKSFIGKILDAPAAGRLEGTAAAVAVAVMNGANIVRVHDVREMKQVARVVDEIQRS
jgi:dihydropteroate synthase